jgi:hypothetical protein
MYMAFDPQSAAHRRPAFHRAKGSRHFALFFVKNAARRIRFRFAGAGRHSL